MPHILAIDANAFVDGSKLTKLTDPDIDSALEADLSDEVIGSVSSAFDVSTWVDQETTPNLIRRIISMKYVGWFFQRVYSENEETSNYGMMLITEANRLLDGLITGTISIPGLATDQNLGLSGPSFEPTDLDLCGPKFAMGQIF